MGALGYAAEAGVLPDRAQSIAHRWFGGVGVPKPGQSTVAAPTADPTTAVPSPQPTAVPTQPSPTPTQPPVEAPDTRSLIGLCHAVAAQPGAGPGPAMSAAAFQRLAAAAGGADRIEAFCTDLLATPSPGQPDPPGPTSPDQPGQPESPGGQGDGPGSGQSGSGSGSVPSQPGGAQTAPADQPAHPDRPELPDQH
ncbi:MAG: hypothetical protein L0Y54_01480 [Sporichthyaceae bacterium]|nr:hypothetical protein [Sporichthyaceae bacterium]